MYSLSRGWPQDEPAAAMEGIFVQNDILHQERSLAFHQMHAFVLWLFRVQYVFPNQDKKPLSLLNDPPGNGQFSLQIHSVVKYEGQVFSFLLQSYKQGLPADLRH